MDLHNKTCDAMPLTQAGVVAFIPALQALLNGFVSVAAIRSRQKLRNNFVYVNVVSLLSANMIFGIVTFYAFLNRAHHFEHGDVVDPANIFSIDNSHPSHSTVKAWWGFRTAFQLALFLTMSANVSALIYALRESSYFVGPGGLTRSGSSSRCQEVKGETPEQKRNKAIGIVILTWFVPLILSIVAATEWNCLHLCECFDAYYAEQYVCQGDTHKECSRVFENMSNSFMVTVIIIWFLLAILLLAIMMSTYRKYRCATSARSSKSTAITSVSYVAESGGTNSQGDDNVFAGGSPKRNSVKNGQAHSLPFRRAKISHLSHSIKSMILITILFILCSAPSMIIIFIDIVTIPYVLNLPAVLLGVVIVYIYGMASPIILVYYMYGLRYAVISLLQSIYCCTKTVVSRGSTAGTRHDTKA